jgi:hypothetical protein
LDLQSALASTVTLEVLTLPTIFIENSFSLRKGLERNQSLLAVVVEFGPLEGKEQMLLEFLSFILVHPVLQRFTVGTHNVFQISSDLELELNTLIMGSMSTCLLTLLSNRVPEVRFFHAQNFQKLKFESLINLALFLNQHERSWTLLDYKSSISSILKYVDFPQDKSLVGEIYFDP